MMYDDDGIYYIIIIITTIIILSMMLLPFSDCFLCLSAVANQMKSFCHLPIVAVCLHITR